MFSKISKKKGNGKSTKYRPFHPFFPNYSRFLVQVHARRVNAIYSDRWNVSLEQWNRYSNAQETM